MKSLFFENIKPHLKHLRILGLYQIDPQSSKLERSLHRLYMSFVLYLTASYAIQQVIQVYQERKEVNKIIGITVLMLTQTDCVYKQVVLWAKQDKIEEILDMFKGPVFNQNVDYHRKLQLHRGRQSKLILRVYNITALVTVFFWVLYPLIMHYQNKHVEFHIYLPFDHNLTPQFYIAWIYVSIQLTVLAAGNSTMDTFITFFFSQCKTQLLILRFELENVVEQSKKEAKDRSMPFAEIFHSRFEHILLLYNKIVEVCYKTLNIFGWVIFYMFLVSGLIFATTAYRMIYVETMSFEFVSLILYMTCILTAIFMYCYYGNEVAYESHQLLESAFTMEWYEIPLEYRNSLIIFMERLKRPIVPMAGTIIPLSNNTFISILRTSYTFYAFLQNTK